MVSSDRQAPRPGEFPITRRGMLRGATTGLIATAVGKPSIGGTATESHARSLILINLVGGPSQLETFDPKPDAPAEIRGPFSSIPTRIAGVRFSEHLPRLASRADRLTVLRSLHHAAAPIHETGFQLLQTGRLFGPGEQFPHLGSVVSCLKGQRGEVPPFVILPARIGSTGVKVSQGQTAGPLGRRFEPWTPPSEPGATLPRAVARALKVGREAEGLQERYGRTALGRDCLRARQLVEAGSRVVVVNMGTTVFETVSWDAHGRAPFSTLTDYAEVLLPTLDRALAALLDDLAERGLLDSTLVLATGELGRSPRLNAYGGRDHWPDVWSGVIAGGGIAGGRVVGASDAQGATPADQPVSLPELLATLYERLGIDPGQTLSCGEDAPFALVEQARPLSALMA